MKRSVLLFTLLFAGLTSTTHLFAEDMPKEIPGKNITIEKLREMFENISEKTPWDMSGPMLWGFFFTHPEPTLLEKAKIELEKKGYRYVDIYLSDKEDPSEPDLYWLHVEKVEVHAPESLDARNDELYLFANRLGLLSYDGMDVGPVSSE